MSRRKPLARRGSTGRIIHNRDPELLPPTEVRRLVEAASAGLRDPIWCSEIGRLHLVGKITSAQFAAAKRWTELAASYSQACQSPRQLRHWRSTPPVARRSILTAPRALGKFADTSAPSPTIWKAATRCALLARQPSALSTAFACRIVRRPAFMKSMLFVRDCNRCRHGGPPGERQAHVRWRRLKKPANRATIARAVSCVAGGDNAD